MDPFIRSTVWLWLTPLERRWPGYEGVTYAIARPCSSLIRASEFSGQASEKPFVSTMNPPPEIDSRVRWWDARGQNKYGIVKAINVLSDNSHVVVIQTEDGQPPTVTLPIDHVLQA
ncbi:hypothetical protein BJY52DRAFT_72973 [Lactarius psammicola]|nr:hypothetical protein BJY52DRAFT_72973 [Lactarius psammicola]